MQTDHTILLESVILSNYKSYAGAVFAGPFDHAITTIVGPNGAGKSCLIEGICFALGMHLSPSALAQVVNHSTPAGASAGVALIFRGGDAPRHLIVERRTTGGLSMDCWQLQACHCKTMSDIPSWVCSSCPIETLQRDALRKALKRSLRIDIDRPEGFVVYQATVIAVAQKSPRELLAFLEGVLGTERLRNGVQGEAATALRLQTRLNAEERAANAARLAEGRHAPSFLAFRTVQSARRRLEEMKREQLKREACYHASALEASEMAAAERHLVLTKLRDVCDERKRGLGGLQAKVKLTEQQKAKASTELARAQRTSARARDDAAKAVLQRKQNAAVQGRASKAIAALRTQLMGLSSAEQQGQMEQAQVAEKTRVLLAQLDAARAALRERETSMDQMEGAGHGSSQQPEGGTRGSKRGRSGEPRASSEACVEVDGAEAVIIRHELDLRRLLSAPAAGSRNARLTAEKRRRAGKEGEKLLAAKFKTAAAIAACESELALHRKAYAEAEASRTYHSSKAAKLTTVAATAYGQLEESIKHLESYQNELDCMNATASTRRGASAIRDLRASSADLSRMIDGYLCELLTVNEEHALAANSAIGQAALQTSLVVHNRLAALRVVEYFKSHRIGVVTCLIRDEIKTYQCATNASRRRDYLALEQCINCEERHRPLVGQLVSRWSLAPNSAMALERTAHGCSGVGSDVVTLMGECILGSGEIRQAARQKQHDPFALTPSAKCVTALTMASPASAPTDGDRLASLLCQLSAAQAKVEAGSHEARQLHRAAADENAAVAVAEERAAVSGSKMRRLCASLGAEQKALGSTAARLAAACAASSGVREQADGVAVDENGRRVQWLREETTRHRAAAGGSSVAARPWHALSEEVVRLSNIAEEHARATDEVASRVRRVASAKKALQTKEKALVQQMVAAQRGLRLTDENVAAHAAKVKEASALVQQGSADRDAALEAAVTLSEQQEVLTDQLSSALRELKRAESISATDGAVRIRQKSALQLLRQQMRLSTGLEQVAPHQEEEGDDDCAGQEIEEEVIVGCEAAESKACTSLNDLQKNRLTLQAEEAVFLRRERALDLTSLEAYLRAADKAATLSYATETTRDQLHAISERVEALQGERLRIFLRGLTAIDDGLRQTFRAFCHHGDCTLEFSETPALLFSEGVSLAVKLPDGEWTRFETLSGGQQALVAVSLTLALHEAEAAPFVLFDEIDAALDTQRVQGLTQHFTSPGENGKPRQQRILVSHRREPIEASGRLIGTYSRVGGSATASVAFPPASGSAT